MATDVKLPELGENVDTAEIVAVLVAEGDRVEKDQAVVEIETDKATVEVPSPAAGRVAELLVRKGDHVTVGQSLLRLEGAEAEEAPAAEETPPAASTRRAPSAAETRAAAEEARAPDRGHAARERARPTRGERGDTERDGGRREPDRGGGRREAERAGEPAAPAARRTPATGGREAARASRVEPEEGVVLRPAARAPIAAPSVRRFAREIGVELGEVEGSGPGGRVSIGDVKRHAREARREAPRLAAWETPEEGDGFEREPLSGIRRTIARRMTEAWTTIPHVTLHRRADVTELEAARRRLKPRAEERGARLTTTAVLVKACAGALRAFPRVNSTLDVERAELLHHRTVDVGVGVDTERGLLVPVLRGVESRGILDLAVELGELAEKARAGRLRPEEMRGAGFTITNLGGLGIERFTPIVNPPEVAVLGVGRAEPTLVPDDAGGARARLLMPLSLSFDHRVLDGADGARFLGWIVRALEEPLELVL